MAQNDLLKRYLDAGMQFTQMTQKRAEAIVRDLVKAGEVQAETAQGLVGDLVDRSRRNTEQLVTTIRSEVRNQLSVVEVVTKDAIARLEDQVAALRSQVQELLPDAISERLPAGTTRRPAKKPAKKKAAKKAPPQKSGAKKAPAKKRAAKKPAPRKSAAKKAAPAKQA